MQPLSSRRALPEISDPVYLLVELRQTDRDAVVGYIYDLEADEETALARTEGEWRMALKVSKSQLVAVRDRSSLRLIPAV